MKIHHIGYLVKNIHEAIKVFEGLSYVQNESGIIYDPERDVDLCFLRNDSYQIELVSPKSADSVVYQLMKKTGNAPYHICYEVEDIDERIMDLRNKGYVPIQMPARAIGINNKRVAFLMNKNIGMIELLEE